MDPLLRRLLERNELESLVKQYENFPEVIEDWKRRTKEDWLRRLPDCGDDIYNYLHSRSKGISS
jgi:hypothetical protein